MRLEGETRGGDGAKGTGRARKSRRGAKASGDLRRSGTCDSAFRQMPFMLTYRYKLF